MINHKYYCFNQINRHVFATTWMINHLINYTCWCWLIQERILLVIIQLSIYSLCPFKREIKMKELSVLISHGYQADSIN